MQIPHPFCCNLILPFFVMLIFESTGVICYKKKHTFQLPTPKKRNFFLKRMSTSLKNFVNSHPTVTLSHTDYGRHFHLGKGVNIPSFPTQRLQTFVETEGLPYRFVVVGQLMSFKVVEDSVCGLKNLKEHHSHAIGY